MYLLSPAQKVKLLQVICLLILCCLTGCALECTGVNPGTSSSIADSKKEGFFIADYSVKQEPEGLFEIVEVWEEKVWFYKVVFPFKKTKVIVDSNCSWILIKVIETPKSSYVYANYSSEWQLSEQNNLASFTGYAGEHLVVSLKKSAQSSDTIRLILAKGKQQIGTITLIRKH